MKKSTVNYENSLNVDEKIEKIISPGDSAHFLSWQNTKEAGPKV